MGADIDSMSPRAACSALLLMVAVLGVSDARAQNAGDGATSTKILALEHAWNQAESTKDLRALDGLFDNALVYVDFDGSLLTKAEFLSRVRSSQLQQVVTESMAVELFGDTAIVTGTYKSREVKNGKSFFRRGRFLDTWVRRNSTWLCVAAQATPIQP